MKRGNPPILKKGIAKRSKSLQNQEPTPMEEESIVLPENKWQQNMVSVGKQNYINYLSAVITEQEQAKNKQQKRSAIRFLQDYFTTSTTIVWPGNEEKLTVSIYNVAKSNYLIQFIVQGEKESQALLTLKFYKNNLTVDTVRMVSPWTPEAIKDLIHLINFALKSPLEYTQQTLSLKENTDINAPLNWLEKEEEYKELSNRLSSQLTVVPQVMLYNTMPVNNINTLWIPIPSTINNPNNISLKLNFSYFELPEDVTSLKKNQYHSWLFNRSSFLKLHGYKTMEKFLRIQVYEESADEKTKVSRKPILDFWCALNMLFAELRDLKKGANLSGKDIMKIFDYLNELFAIQTTYLTDASRANEDNERSEGQIVFRVLMGIAYGKTWYEGLGYKPLSTPDEGLLRGWPDDKDQPFILHQNVEHFLAAREILRNMSLNDVYQYFCNEEITHPTEVKRSETLAMLCEKYFGINVKQNPTDAPTLSKLTQTVYDAYKKDTTHLEEDLQKVYSLLILPEYYLQPPPTQDKPTKDKPFHELLSHLVFTKFFYKEAKKDTTTPTQKMDTSPNQKK